MMGVSRLAVSVLVATVLAMPCACSSGEPRTEQTWEPFAGEAYPDTRPKVVLPAGDFAVVPASGSDTVTVVDLAAGKVVGASPIGRNPVALDGPHQIACDLSRRTAYAVLSYPGTLETAGNHAHGASQRTGWVQAFGLDDLRPRGEVRVDANPGELAVSEDGRRLVVTHFDLAAAADLTKPIDQRRATLALLDPTAMKPFGTPQPDKLLVCVAPHGVALSRPSGQTAFVACNGEDALAIVDLDDISTPVVRVPVGDSPYGVSLSPDGKRAATGTRAGRSVRFLDVASRTMEPLVIPALGETYVPTWSRDGARLYVPTRARDAVAIVDAKTGATVKTRIFDGATCRAPIEVVLGSDAAVVHLVCEGDASAPGALVTLDGETLETRARVEVGFFPGRPFVGRGP